MSDIEISFFENSELEFVESSHDERELNNIKLNSMSLTLLNPKLETGEKLKGSVNIFVRRELPPGRIVLKLKSYINIHAKKKYSQLLLEKTLEKSKTTYKKKYDQILKSKGNESYIDSIKKSLKLSRKKILPKFMNRNLISRMISNKEIIIDKQKMTQEQIALVLSQKFSMDSKKRPIFHSKLNFIIFRK